MGTSSVRIAAACGWLCALAAAGSAAWPATSRAQTTPGAPVAPVAAAADSCTDLDLVRAALITGNDVEGMTRRVQDIVLAQEGTVWNAPQAVQLKNPNGRLNIDLRAEHELKYFVLQGDDNDAYVVEGSTDGINYRPIWNAPVATTGQGLRTRWEALPKPARARYLRVYGAGGDGFYSISELRAHCKRPKVWPPKLLLPPKLYGWRAIDNQVMVWIKGYAAAFGSVVILLFMLLRKREHVLRRTRNALLALVGVFGFLSFWNIGHFHFDHYIHIWEHYHYYMGAKYAPELRFGRLYECTAAADIADGLKSRVKKRTMRDLAHSNELATTDAIVADPTHCTKHFTPERWQAFRNDIRFFRGRFSRERWDESQSDHGYNGTPVWGILGRFIADHGELTWEKIENIAYIDSVLLVAMWVIVWWAFGWAPACAALLWWGFNFPARFYWNGGSFLRYDWQFWMVVGICLLRKRWNTAAGMALTYATLLRIFPGFIVLALILKALARMVRLRRLVISRSHLRFAIGCIIALAVLIPASSWATNGLDAWPEFAQNSAKHLNTALTNNMGLKTVLGYDFDTRAMFMRSNDTIDPFKGWKDARHFYYSTSRPIHIALLILFAILLAKAADREPDWAAACLGAGMIVMASELTCYYYGFLLTYGLLWERRKLPALLATACAGVTCLLSELIAWNDDHFAAMSLSCAILVVLVTAQSAFGKRPQTTEQDDDRPAEPERPAPIGNIPAGQAAE